MHNPGDQLSLHLSPLKGDPLQSGSGGTELEAQLLEGGVGGSKVQDVPELQNELKINLNS